MVKKVPILDQCSLSGHQTQEISLERLSAYLKRNQNLVFPHRHDFYHCVLFIEGGGNHQIDFEKFEVCPWQIYFMSLGQIHTWDFKGDMEGYVINFDSNTFNTFLLQTDYLDRFTFFDGTLSDAVFVIDPLLRTIVVDILERMLANPSNKDFAKVSLLYFFKLLELHAPVSNKRIISSYNHTILRNFMSLLESNYKTLRLPKEYAALLYITPHHLNAVCKESLGMSSGEIIRNRVLLEAKRLLAIREYSISEIAYELSFSDNSYFTKFFKKIEQITPEEFRIKLVAL